jgi:hypothetical protein
LFRKERFEFGVSRSIIGLLQPGKGLCLSGNAKILPVEDFFGEVKLAGVSFAFWATEISSWAAGGPQTVVVCFHAVSIARLVQRHKCGLPTLFVNDEDADCWGYNE